MIGVKGGFAYKTCTWLNPFEHLHSRDFEVFLQEKKIYRTLPLEFEHLKHKSFHILKRHKYEILILKIITLVCISICIGAFRKHVWLIYIVEKPSHWYNEWILPGNFGTYRNSQNLVVVILNKMKFIG